MFEEVAGTLTRPTGLALGLAAAFVAAYVVLLIVWAARRQEREAARDAGPAGQALPIWATPRGRPTFVGLAALFALVVWIAAWTIAPDRRAFLSSREWHAQPLYLVVHFATVRVFASILAANFLAGAAHLDLGPAAAVQAVRQQLRPILFVVALIVAMPFIAADLRYFMSDRYAKLSGMPVPSSADWLMFGIWTLEWVLNAVVWVMLVAFLWLNVRVLRRHAFTAPIHVVLMEKHYRPFLRMSAQGSTVVLAFSIFTAVYIAYAGGEVTDYLGLICTILLLAACFLLQWIVVRRKVDRSVMTEIATLQRSVRPLSARDFVASHASGAASTADSFAEASAMMRMMHLERLHGGVGRREATDVTMRLMAPAATAAWQLWQNGGALIERFLVWARVVLA